MLVSEHQHNNHTNKHQYWSFLSPAFTGVASRLSSQPGGICLAQGSTLLFSHLWVFAAEFLSLSLSVRADHISTSADLWVQFVDQNMCCCCLSWLAVSLNASPPPPALSCLLWAHCKWRLMFVANSMCGVFLCVFCRESAGSEIVCESGKIRVDRPGCHV